MEVRTMFSICKGNTIKKERLIIKNMGLNDKNMWKFVKIS